MVAASRTAAQFTALLDLAEEDPCGALRRWLRAFNSGAPRGTLEGRDRLLSRLAARARNIVGPADAVRLESLIAEAQQEMENALRRAVAPTGLGFTLAGEALPVPRMGNAMSTAPLQLRHPPDTIRLDEIASSWSDEDWCAWLGKGFAAVREERANAHLAFPPLRLYPIGRYIEQLSETFTEAVDFGSPMREQVLKAVRSHLSIGRQCDSADDELFWRLLHQLGSWDPNVGIGRSYVSRIMEDADDEIPSDVVEIICATAWDCSADPSARAYFYEWLDTKVESPVVTANLIAATLDEAAFEEALVRDVLPYAASTALALLPDGASPVFDHLESLIKAGRLLSVSADVFGAEINSAEDIRRLLPYLATGVTGVESVNWTPPEPIGLELAEIPILAESVDGP